MIGDRSFGDDPQTVTKYAGAFAEGLREENIIPVLKHFPRAGDGQWQHRLRGCNHRSHRQTGRRRIWFPYETLLLDTPVAVMTTNASVPGLTGKKPASLSPATYQLLRDDYGFTGVVMTDSLSAAPPRMVPTSRPPSPTRSSREPTSRCGTNRPRPSRSGRA